MRMHAHTVSPRRIGRANDLCGVLRVYASAAGRRMERARDRYGVHQGLLLDFGLVEGDEDDDECRIDPL